MRIQVNGQTVKLWASANDTYEWAHRSGSAWPGSQLSDKRLFVEFQRGDLVDLSVNGRSDRDLSADELNAFTSDALAYKLDPDHPDYDILVTRFQDTEFVKPPKVTKAKTTKRKKARKTRAKKTTTGISGSRG